MLDRLYPRLVPQDPTPQIPLNVSSGGQLTIRGEVVERGPEKVNLGLRSEDGARGDYIVSSTPRCHRAAAAGGCLWGGGADPRHGGQGLICVLGDQAVQS